ncbi:hypothetical protein BDV28DRAFT_134598 [Aspergillus coremiiformis]|uniref:Uncharacterized protein n=1 Tax=Aspergillus coremiiformis TaxID=138285 RepID=A0A5N6Z507_9EURO|nr:hypothetical protein BDV28DRAFT_134598 [Aspergillus coremiiformis]
MFMSPPHVARCSYKYHNNSLIWRKSIFYIYTILCIYMYNIYTHTPRNKKNEFKKKPNSPPPRERKISQHLINN